MSASPTAAEQTLAARPVRSSLRILNALLFGAFAALGFGLVARPARLEWRSLGVLHPVLPWDVPLGRLFLVIALGLAIETLRLGLAVASGSKLRALARAPLLLLVLGALIARSQAGEPLPPASAAPRLISALRAAADALDRSFADRGHYDPEKANLDSALAAVGGSLFVSRGRELPLRTRVIENAAHPQAEPLEGDPPGTVYLALSADRAQVILTVLTLDAAGKIDLLRNPSSTGVGKPLAVEAHAGTHSAPGRDAIVPEYPGMGRAFEPKPAIAPR